MFKKEKLLYYILITLPLICLLIAYFVEINKNSKQQIIIDELNSKIEYYNNLDTTYVERRDSIAYNIEYRDSVIYNIKYEYETQKQIVADMPDDAVVDKFKELVWAD